MKIQLIFASSKTRRNAKRRIVNVALRQAQTELRRLNNHIRNEMWLYCYVVQSHKVVKSYDGRDKEVSLNLKHENAYYYRYTFVLFKGITGYLCYCFEYLFNPYVINRIKELNRIIYV